MVIELKNVVDYVELQQRAHSLQLAAGFFNNCKDKGKKLGRIPVLAYLLTRQNNTQRIFLDSGFRRNDGFGVFNCRSNIKQYMGIAGTDTGQDSQCGYSSWVLANLLKADLSKGITATQVAEKLSSLV